jgi:hypothetical protein
MRSLGHLQDRGAVGLLIGILRENMVKNPGKAADLHELGWQQKPVYLAATAAEALGRIGTKEAEKALVGCMPKLLDFWNYTLWTGDHSWLMGCHSSVIHYRIIEGLDSMETKAPEAVVIMTLKSVPIDTDRALLYETDNYENLSGRVVRRSGMGDEAIEACLAVLGDSKAKASKKIRDAVTASPPALSTLPQDPEPRAAQIASVVCVHKKYAPRFRAALNRYRKTEPSRTKSWTCFFLARLLGRLKDAESGDTLVSILTDDATEASFGYEDQPNVFVYKAMTPFYRAAAADALGRIGDDRAVAVLMDVVADYDNAISVRHAAARSLGMLDVSNTKMKLRMLAADYPEVSVRRALLEACR